MNTSLNISPAVHTAPGSAVVLASDAARWDRVASEAIWWAAALAIVNPLARWRAVDLILEHLAPEVRMPDLDKEGRGTLARPLAMPEQADEYLPRHPWQAGPTVAPTLAHLAARAAGAHPEHRAVLRALLAGCLQGATVRGHGLTTGRPVDGSDGRRGQRDGGGRVDPARLRAHGFTADDVAALLAAVADAYGAALDTDALPLPEVTDATPRAARRAMARAAREADPERFPGSALPADPEHGPVTVRRVDPATLRAAREERAAREAARRLTLRAAPGERVTRFTPTRAVETTDATADRAGWAAHTGAPAPAPTRRGRREAATAARAGSAVAAIADALRRRLAREEG